MNLPNKLTISRIFLTFIFMLFLFSRGLTAKIIALLVFLAASLTDLYDGRLARRHNMITDFGKFMDPIADKILVLAAFFAFIELELVPAWMVVIIVLREFVVTGLRLLALTKNIVLPAQEGGKHKTVSQMAAIFIILVFLLLKEIGLRIPAFWSSEIEIYFQSVIFILMLITVALTLISGASFLYRNRAVFKNNRQGDVSQKLIKFIATFGGLGYSRIAPGTTGCLGAAVLYLLIKQSLLTYSLAGLILLALGFLVSGRAEAIFKSTDAKPIVIDDACGLLIALFLIPFSYTNLLIVFLLFRTIDIAKPFPIKRIEGLSGGLGIIGDDIIAGIYTNLIFRLALKFFLS